VTKTCARLTGEKCQRAHRSGARPCRDHTHNAVPLFVRASRRDGRIHAARVVEHGPPDPDGHLCSVWSTSVCGAPNESFSVTRWRFLEHDAEIANSGQLTTLSEWRTCLFFKQCRWRYFGGTPTLKRFTVRWHERLVRFNVPATAAQRSSVELGMAHVLYHLHRSGRAVRRSYSRNSTWPLNIKIRSVNHRTSPPRCSPKRRISMP
jgi:hypothetical protein